MTGEIIHSRAVLVREEPVRAMRSGPVSLPELHIETGAAGELRLVNGVGEFCGVCSSIEVANRTLDFFGGIRG